ncbi:uncharacterized protein N7503_003239 [Penicillium pulvis]|uniref:uncharacterized protein n=1 Tax=Penicillium pulvis TaxID=1562058 RepID=UPI002546D884|nr:uncharacterized protein N7503_003239 [Penicillium pulvis]KAJ5805637.1 hypothetical protein N7503_003239 [Penicillium pulvis]
MSAIFLKGKSISYPCIPSLTFIILILIFMSTQSIPHSPEMTLPDTKNHCLDPTINNINHEALKIEIQETIKTETKEEVQNGLNEIPMYTLTTPHSAEMLLPSPKAGQLDTTVDSIERGVLKCENEESIKEKIEDSSHVDSKEEMIISTHTTPHSPPKSNVNSFDISSDSTGKEAIIEEIKEETKKIFKEELKEEFKEATREAIKETKEKAPRRATKRKINEILDDEGSADVNHIAPVPSNTVDLPVHQAWNSLEEAYEAILGFVHRQGYGATYYKGPYRTSLPEYVHLGCDLLEMKEYDRVKKDGSRESIRAKKTSTCTFGAIIMNCLNSWRIVKISSARHSHEPLPPRALPSQHRLERKRKAALIYQMIQEGFDNNETLQQIQLQDPKTCLDRADIKYVRHAIKQKHKSELWIQLQKGATDDDLPSLGPSSPVISAKRRQLEQDTNKAYIIQQVQQGLSNEAIVQKIRLQNPNSHLDSLDIANVRGKQKNGQSNALRGQDLKGSTDDDPTEDHQLSKAESNDGLAEDYKFLVREVSDEKDCKLPKTEMDDDLIESYKFWKEEMHDEKNYKLPKEEMSDQNYKLPKEEMYDDLARV